MTQSQSHIDGVVLAGGQARRMGGVNKALLRCGDGYLFEHAVRNLACVSAHILISCNRDVAQFSALGFTVVDDGEFEDKGPLAGILAAMTHSAASYLAVAACDQLALPDRVYTALAQAATPECGAYAQQGDEQIPTCAVVPQNLQNVLEQALRADQLRLTAFMRAHCAPVRFEDVVFGNVNRLCDNRLQ